MVLTLLGCIKKSVLESMREIQQETEVLESMREIQGERVFAGVVGCPKRLGIACVNRALETILSWRSLQCRSRA